MQICELLLKGRLSLPYMSSDERVLVKTGWAAVADSNASVLLSKHCQQTATATRVCGVWMQRQRDRWHGNSSAQRWELSADITAVTGDGGNYNRSSESLYHVTSRDMSRVWGRALGSRVWVELLHTDMYVLEGRVQLTVVAHSKRSSC